MAFKPNYNHERAERERAKQRKQQEKANKRRTGDEDAPAADAPAVNETDPSPASPPVGETIDNGGSHGAQRQENAD